MPLLINKAGHARPILVDHVLQRAFAAPVTDRAVQRVIDQQQLQNAVLRLFDFRRDRVHDHAFRHGDGAGRLDFVHLLDLDQAHPARARRLEPGMVAEVGNVRPRLERRRDDQRAFRDGDRFIVNRQIDHVHRRLLRRRPLRCFNCRFRHAYFLLV